MISKIHILRFLSLFAIISILGFTSLILAVSYEEGTSSNEFIGSVGTLFWKINYFHTVYLMKNHHLSSFVFLLSIILTQVIQTFMLYWLIAKVFYKKNVNL
jgi:hypothetical protein